MTDFFTTAFPRIFILICIMNLQGGKMHSMLDFTTQVVGKISMYIQVFLEHILGNAVYPE